MSGPRAAPDGEPERGAPERGAAAEVPWAGAAALRDALAIYFSAQVLGVLFASVLASSPGGPDAVLPGLVALSPLTSLAVTLLWIHLRYRGAHALILGRRRPRAADVVVGVGVGVLCLLGQRVVVLAIATLAERSGSELPTVQETFRTIAQRPGALPLFVVTTVLLAPIAEELLFRGVLFQGLRRTTGFWLAALASGLLFTLPHLLEGGGVLAAVVIASGILPLGVVFAALVERRGSVVPAMVAHATYNAIGVALLVLLEPSFAA